MEDSVLPALVHTNASRPDIYIVSANIVNQPLMSWVHWSLGAVRPYLPERDRDFRKFLLGTSDWRSSSLPSWSGPMEYNSSSFDVSSYVAAGRLWLPIRGHDDRLLAGKTPMAGIRYGSRGGGSGHSEWQMAAQQHYSFLEHLENNELWRYKFRMWDFQDRGLGIQLTAMTGTDINAAKPID